MVYAPLVRYMITYVYLFYLYNCLYLTNLPYNYFYVKIYILFLFLYNI